MTYNPDIHHRHSIRLREYDYSEAGAYFVTACTHGRECLFGSIDEGAMRLNEAGRVVQEFWRSLPERFPNVVIDEFVVMPNHVHGIIVITGSVGALLAAPDFELNPDDRGAASGAHTLGQIMRAFKSVSAINVNRIVDRQGQPLWQRNYYDRVIRNEDELGRICEYIRCNPIKWEHDEENPANTIT